MYRNQLFVGILACFIILLPSLATAQSDKVKAAMADLKAQGDKVKSAMADLKGAIDTVANKDGGAVTLFAKDGDQYVRIATTVKKEDGTSAVGTSLVADSPALPKLNNGEPYYGDATVFGKSYDARYEPIKDASGAVIGAFFVGQNK